MQILFCFLVLLTSASLTAQPSLFDALHAAGDTVVIDLDTDWRKLIRFRKNKEWQPVVMTVKLPAGPLEIPGKIRTRGNIRLQTCQNPSLKIKLNKAALAAAGYNDCNDLKFVLQCTSANLGAQYLRREQLAYDLHRVFSDHSHRLVSAVLRPTAKNDPELRAFLIETEEQLERRYGTPVLESTRMSTAGLDRAAYLNMCLFNYLILNTDWAVFNLHNVEFITVDSNKLLTPLPYDFDFSGWVATTYAAPQAQLPITTVQEAYWLGKRVTPEELQSVAAHFLNRREAALALVSNYPGLTDRDRERLLRRLTDFFAELSDERRLLAILR